MAVVDTVARSKQRGQQAVSVVDVAVESAQGVRGATDGEIHRGEFAFGVGADKGATDIVGIHHSVLCVILSTDDTDDTVFSHHIFFISHGWALISRITLVSLAFTIRMVARASHSQNLFNPFHLLIKYNPLTYVSVFIGVIRGVHLPYKITKNRSYNQMQMHLLSADNK